MTTFRIAATDVGGSPSALLRWIEEREAIRRRRESGASPPWTDDPILAAWSFCNVRREHDRVTRWIAQNWRDPHAADLDLWFGMAVARFVNWPDALAELGWPVPWNGDAFVAVLSRRLARGDTAFGPAYKIMPTGQRGSKAESVARLLGCLWSGCRVLRPKPGQTLAAWHALLASRRGLGNFMAGQIVADVKQVQLLDAADWWTFAASGPGSRRGLNRVMGRDVEKKWDEYAWRHALRRLHDDVAPELESVGVGRLCAQDLQNCLCEFDKYERVRLGEGKPKRRFVSRDCLPAPSPSAAA